MSASDVCRLYMQCSHHLLLQLALGKLALSLGHRLLEHLDGLVLTQRSSDGVAVLAPLHQHTGSLEGVDDLVLVVHDEGVSGRGTLQRGLIPPVPPVLLLGSPQHRFRIDGETLAFAHPLFVEQILTRL